MAVNLFFLQPTVCTPFGNVGCAFRRQRGHSGTQIAGESSSVLSKGAVSSRELAAQLVAAERQAEERGQVFLAWLAPAEPAAVQVQASARFQALPQAQAQAWEAGLVREQLHSPEEVQWARVALEEPQWRQLALKLSLGPAWLARQCLAWRRPTAT